jgi:hypothetical protein
LRNAILGGWRERVPGKDSDQDRRGTLPSLLDQHVSDCRVVARIQLGDARGTRGSAQDVSYLGGSRYRVQVRGACGIASGARSKTCCFGARFLCCSVRVQCGDTLQLGPFRAVDELPCGIEGCARTRITGNGLLEHREDFLSALCHVARYDSQLVHGQLEITGNGRHGLDPPTAWECYPR